jgi:hypothetical protein
MRALVIYESMYGDTRAVASLRASLEALDAEGVLAAAFDTRLSGMPVLTGCASWGIARLLTRRGCRVLLTPESFLVGGQNTLLEGEAVRARQWGAQVGEIARAAFATSHLPRTLRPAAYPR